MKTALSNVPRKYATAAVVLGAVLIVLSLCAWLLSPHCPFTSTDGVDAKPYLQQVDDVTAAVQNRSAAVDLDRPGMV